ncbi:MAG: glucose 1-dehydrogenase [Rhodospirillales bacterium]|nr:MAG: glucose 1-dehydrogenase [Rhodospirillales bacterium]
MKLKDRVAVITGGGSGIGRATAGLFAREGARLVLVDRDVAALADTKAALGDADCRTIACDVTDEPMARQIVDEATAAWGGVDILVTAAGISRGQPAATTALEDWNAVMAVNATGTFLWIRECLRPMVARGGGSIVTVASQLARAGGRGNAAYIASKGAVAALTYTTALDYADQGIRCNAVLPGATETPLLKRSFARQPDPAAARERSRARHPMGRLGAPEEIAAAILFLASDESSWITGVELPVDGGWLAG